MRATLPRLAAPSRRDVPTRRPSPEVGFHCRPPDCSYRPPMPFALEFGPWVRPDPERMLWASPVPHRLVAAARERRTLVSTRTQNRSIVTGVLQQLAAAPLRVTALRPCCARISASSRRSAARGHRLSRCGMPATLTVTCAPPASNVSLCPTMRRGTLAPGAPTATRLSRSTPCQGSFQSGAPTGCTDQASFIKPSPSQGRCRAVQLSREGPVPR